MPNIPYEYPVPEANFRLYLGRDLNLFVRAGRYSRWFDRINALFSERGWNFPVSLGLPLDFLLKILHVIDIDSSGLSHRSVHLHALFLDHGN